MLNYRWISTGRPISEIKNRWDVAFVRKNQESLDRVVLSRIWSRLDDGDAESISLNERIVSRQGRAWR
jgi:hypothetical protein